MFQPSFRFACRTDGETDLDSLIPVEPDAKRRPRGCDLCQSGRTSMRMSRFRSMTHQDDMCHECIQGSRNALTEIELLAVPKGGPVDTVSFHLSRSMVIKVIDDGLLGERVWSSSPSSCVVSIRLKRGRCRRN
jgi:hypothetical protein